MLSRPLRRAKGWIGPLCAVAAVAGVAGCRSGEPVLQPVMDAVKQRSARPILSGYEPTGLVGETEARKEFWNTSRSKVEAVDVEALNRAVEAVSTAAEQVRSRLEALSAERINALMSDVSAATAELRKQLKAARLDELAAAVRLLTERLDYTVRQLDVNNANNVLRESATAVAELRKTVEHLNNRLVQTSQDTQKLLDEANNKLSALPADELRGTLDHLDRAIGSVDSVAAGLVKSEPQVEAAIAAAHLTFRVATGVLVLLGLSCLAWLMRLLRGRPA